MLSKSSSCRGNYYDAASWFVAVVCYLGSMLVFFCHNQVGDFGVAEGQGHYTDGARLASGLALLACWLPIAGLAGQAKQ